MFALIAAILAAVGYILAGSGAHTSAWLSPGALTLAAIACLALHLCGIPWSRKP
jgi:hypothetical protein